MNQPSKLFLAFLTAGTLVLSTGCGPRVVEVEYDDEPMPVYVEEVEVDEIAICDDDFETTMYEDDCNQMRGHYYDPITQALVYRAILGGPTTVVHNNYVLPTGTVVRPGTVKLPTPVRVPRSAPSTLTPSRPAAPTTVPTTPPSVKPNTPAPVAAPATARPAPVTPSAPVRSTSPSSFTRPRTTPNPTSSPRPSGTSTSSSSSSRRR